MNAPLLRVENLKMHFPVHKGIVFRKEAGAVRAVDGVSFEIKEGETLGLVGESGCGKSTTGRAVLQLMKPTSGKVFFREKELTSSWRKQFGRVVWSEELRELRRDMQMIFQDPYASLNPRMTVENIISEPLRTFNIASGADLRTRVQKLMKRVGMDPRYIRRYPHEFSGGQRQRIGIARALALEPDLIVADEPISALDVSIQAQILNLMKELQNDLNLSYLFIAHDLSAVRHISDRIAVMYLGHLVEIGNTKTIVENPQHPYTKALISAIPVPDPKIEKNRTRLKLVGDVPSPLNPPSGCTFHTRCPVAVDRCSKEVPTLKTITSGHQVSCHLVEPVPPG